METENSMTVEASLSGGAAKLFLHLLRRGRVWGSMAEMMAGAGISKPTYLAAKRELLDKEVDLRGFSFLTSQVKEVDHEVKEVDPGSQETLPQVKEVDPAGQGTLPGGSSLFTSTDTITDADLQRAVQVLQAKPFDLTPEQAARNSATATGPQFYVGTTAPASMPDPGYMLGPGGRAFPIQERNFSEVLEKTARDLVQEADLLPDGGDPKRPTSEFQTRRHAQVKALCMAYSEMFPTKPPLQTTMAKQLLQLSGNVAEDVYDAFEDTRNNPRDIEYPASWVRKMLEARPKAEAPVTPKPREEDHSSEYLEVTPEMRAHEAKLLARLRNVPGAQPYWFGEDDD